MIVTAALNLDSSSRPLPEDFITTERLDPVVSPGKVSSHVHSGTILNHTLTLVCSPTFTSSRWSNFRFTTNTAQLRQSECTSVPIPEDKSNYWFPVMNSRWANGTFTSLDGGPPGATTAFPDDFRMLSGDPTLRTYDSNSFAQQAVSFLCLDFNGVSTQHNGLPLTPCPSGVRAQICWDGKNVDSPDHKSHVSFRSGGPDSVTLPRIFMEVYWGSNQFDQFRSQAMNTTQPFVFSYGDRTGYGYHADFINGWDSGVLQGAVDGCTCNDSMGLFNMNQGLSCKITKSIDEVTTGTIPKLPGNNPVQEEGQRATIFPDTTTPAIIAPVFAFTGDSATQTGSIVTPATTVGTVSITTTAPSIMTVPATTTKPATTILTTAKPTTSSTQGGIGITIPGIITITLPTIPLLGIPL
ncbi:hypothetical protein BDQ17DRAFT_1481235 [Cyathus striatus]|nr:hypothetical protein BDQ17DRAFT_1481235 [Cyathus striatus]